MRICFITPEAWPYLSLDRRATGGAERQVVLLSEEMSAEHNVHLVVSEPDHAINDDSYNFNVHNSYNSDDNTLTKINKIYSVLKGISPDVCIVRGNPRLAIVVSTLCNIMGYRFVYNVANDDDIPPFSKIYTSLDYIFKSIPLLMADKLIVQSERQSCLAQKYNDGTQIVPNGYPKASQPVSFNGGSILWVGRLDFEQKQPHYFVELAKNVPSEQFVMIGPPTGDERDPALLEEIDKVPNITYIGEVRPDKIHSYYRDSKLFVNTSAYEGFPNTFLEAWRFGVPVIGLNVDPNRFLDIEMGCFANGDFDKLISIVEKLSRSKQLRKRMGDKCHREFENKFQIEKVAMKYIEALEPG